MDTALETVFGGSLFIIWVFLVAWGIFTFLSLPLIWKHTKRTADAAENMDAQLATIAQLSQQNATAAGELNKTLSSLRRKK